MNRHTTTSAAGGLASIPFGLVSRLGSIVSFPGGGLLAVLRQSHLRNAIRDPLPVASLPL